jgi:hypothetical protein
MGFHPSEPFPPHGAAPASAGRCPHAVCRTAYLRRLRRYAAASGLCSPLESDTNRTAFTPSEADALMGLRPSSVLSPPLLGPAENRTDPLGF